MPDVIICLIILFYAMLPCLNYISLLFSILLCAFVTYFIKYCVTVTVLLCYVWMIVAFLQF